MKPSEVKPGDRFGNLTVQSIQQHYRSSTGRKDGKEALCLCDCGNQKIVTLSHLVSGNTSSCGCLQKQSCIETGCKTGAVNIKHAHSYLQSHPEIRQETGRRTIKHALASLSIHPEIRQETGSQNVKHAAESQRRDPNFESSLQKEYRLFLEKNNILYETEFFLEDHYFDFKVNNFLIEIHGDIYHASKYENFQNSTAKGPSTQYLDSAYHKSLFDLATKNGYRLIQLWEHNSFEFNSSLLLSQLNSTSDINNYIEYINNHKVICNDYGFQVSGSYFPDPGKWISTGYREVVSESYEKGKVLVYNSGYTILGGSVW